ncbi:hypothetical protein [Amycolatopsis pigmentata]|uniref:Uncharacterized protein n=1 Tax=Amycolatopsis pigmentata TaxID=450801 RepID=A0ABW5FTM3_9PSEU
MRCNVAVGRADAYREWRRMRALVPAPVPGLRITTPERGTAMGGFWLWSVILLALLLVIPLGFVIATSLRRASRKVETILAEELPPPEDHCPPTPSGEGPDHRD